MRGKRIVDRSSDGLQTMSATAGGEPYRNLAGIGKQEEVELMLRFVRRQICQAIEERRRVEEYIEHLKARELNLKEELEDIKHEKQ